jgi:hypothetical protein
MRKILFFLVLISFASCVTRKACERKFPPEVMIIRKDSIIRTTETIYRDTTIYTHIPGDSVSDTKPVLQKDGIISSDTSNLATAFAKSRAYVDNGKLIHELIQKDTLIQKKIDNAIRLTWVRAERFFETSKTITIEVNRLTGWQHFQLWTLRILIGIIILFLLIRFTFPGLFS